LAGKILASTIVVVECFDQCMFFGIVGNKFVGDVEDGGGLVRSNK